MKRKTEEIKNRQRGRRTYGVLGARVALWQQQLLAEASSRGGARGDSPERFCGGGRPGAGGDAAEEQQEKARGRGKRPWAHHVHTAVESGDRTRRLVGFGWMDGPNPVPHDTVFRVGGRDDDWDRCFSPFPTALPSSCCLQDRD